MRKCVDCSAEFTPNVSGRPRIRCYVCSPLHVSSGMDPLLRETACGECGAVFVGPRQRLYCSTRCRYKARDRARGAVCAGGCGAWLWGGSTSLPPGQRMCRPCRSRRRAEQIAATPPRPPRVLKRRGSPGERGYGPEHRAARALFLSRWTPGDPCARCFEPMLEGEPLDLDHADDRGAYLGLAHAECNRGHIPVGGRRPPASRRGRHPCPICGASFLPSRGGRTCSRACGAEMRRRNAAAA